jgi:hypothetical protein
MSEMVESALRLLLLSYRKEEKLGPCGASTGAVAFADFADRNIFYPTMEGR